MQIITTIDYPTRYVAQNNPECLVQQLNISYLNGYELAAYYHPVGNRFDGVVAKITVCEDGFLAEIGATRPGEKGEHFNIDKPFSNYEAAEVFLIEIIEEAKRFVERSEF